jgi:hypothetical protein
MNREKNYLSFLMFSEGIGNKHTSLKTRFYRLPF